jgi:hypothetical protein
MTTGRRDVGAFKSLLWQWFTAESEVRFIAEGNTPDWKAEGTKEAEEAAEHALAAVLKAYAGEPSATTLRQYAADDMSTDAMLVRSLATGNLHPALNGPVGRAVFALLQRITGKAPRTEVEITCSDVGDKVFLSLLFGSRPSMEERLAHGVTDRHRVLEQLKQYEQADPKPPPPQNSRDSDFP